MTPEQEALHVRLVRARALDARALPSVTGLALGAVLPTMPGLLINLLICVIVCGFVYWIFTLLPLPPPVKNVVLAILALSMLFMFLSAFGVVGPGWSRWR